MAVIEATLDAEAAAMVDTALTLLADAARDAAARAGAPDGRSHDQRRADALTGIFAAILNGTPLPQLLHQFAPAPGGFSPAQAQPGAAQPQPGAAGEVGEVDEPEASPFRAGPGFVPPPAVPAWWQPPALPSQQRRRPHLVITVHASTLTGDSDLAGELAGYGAVTAQAARDIARQAATADLIILGQPPGPRGSSGVGSYRPGDRLVKDVIARNPTCRAPGCRRRAEQCDLDHVVPYARGGTTTVENLISLCRHHRLKTHSGWRLTQHPAEPGETTGTIEWTSPAGRTYLAPPDDRPGTAHW